MASRKFTAEERRNKAEEIALYIIKEYDNGKKVSTRSLAKIFGISNYTVSILTGEYLEKQFPELHRKVNQILMENVPKSIENIEVQKRVLEAAKLVLQGKTTEEIATKLHVTNNVIYEDLQTRLKKIDSSLYNQIVLIRESNSRSNLNEGNDTYVSQERDELGHFGSIK